MSNFVLDVVIQMPTIETFKACKKEDSFLAVYVTNRGEGLEMQFRGKTESMARQKAVDYWQEAIAARQSASIVQSASMQPAEMEMVNSAMVSAKRLSDESASAERQEGRGQQFVGKVWLLHHGLKERARVLPEQVAAYEARGFVKGGPKTPL